MVARVYLVPGFFGFANLGDLRYFAHVEEVLHAAFLDLGRQVDVIRVDTLAAANIARRTAKLREIIVETAGGDRDPIHVVGHSTGALDARLLLTPDRAREVDDALLQRVRSVVSIAGAHRGTPVAPAFKSAFGKQLLKLLGTMTVHTLRLGPVSVGSALAVSTLFGVVDSVVGARKDLLDQVEEGILRDFTPERRAQLEGFFEELSNDQTLLEELGPDMARHFDLQTPDRPGVRYGCVVTCGARPSLASLMSMGLSPTAAASHALYRGLYSITSRSTTSDLPHAAVDAHHKLQSQLGEMPLREDNDGVVPTLSQFHGTLIRAVLADHHDVIGHFDDATHDPPHVDWLLSMSGFRRRHFVELWTDIAHFIVDSERLPVLPPHPTSST